MLKTNTFKTCRALSAKASPREAAARAATRTTPWAERLQTALICVFLTRILYLPPTAAGSRGDTHAIQEGCAQRPGHGGDKSISDGLVQAKSGSWQKRQRACGTRHHLAL
jgi:hypothetical protein